MIFNRQWYERYEGRPELDEWRASLIRLSPSERAELVAFLCACGSCVDLSPRARSLWPLWASSDKYSATGITARYR